jgi:predicted O-methyltransferase YrrM
MVNRSRIIKWMDNPVSALLYLYDKIRLSFSDSGLDIKHYRNGHLSRLFSYTNIEQEDVDRYVNEMEENEHILKANERLAEIGSGSRPPPRSVGLYILTRYFQPSVCIETGVRHGESTVYILEALRQNGEGELYSIDVPSPNLPDSESSGWIIPEELRGLWTLTLGKSQNELEPILEAVGNIDMFFHDSYHKYPLMKWEFNTVLEYMDEGIIASDDINRNHAFLEMCSNVDSTLNMFKPYELGGKGVFAFAFVGDEVQNEGIKMAEYK